MDDIKDIDGVPSPASKLRRMADNTSVLEVDHSLPAVMYYRSGLQMVRMADMYVKQGSFRDAYVLYLRFITLFVEKIRDHPGWTHLPSHDRKMVSDKVKEAIPKAEKLKEQLRQQFELEYREKVLILEKEKERRKVNAIESKKQEQNKQIHPQSQRHQETENTNFDRNISDVVTGPLIALDSITYPDADSAVLSHQQGLPAAPIIDSSSNLYSFPLNDTNLHNHSSRLLPTIDRSTKPASLMSLSTQSHYGLRNVVVPSQLVERFLVLAHLSTVKTLKHVDQNQLVISHLILPKQTATPDSCTTENEEEVFSYQDKHNLITLGWIHTHPSQTAFLSSVDLHTHCSYQLMMPEAVAIVCAPRYKDNSIFCLTQSYGLDYIAKCNRSGFHPHPAEPPLFIIAEHARLESELSVEVIDMRR